MVRDSFVYRASWLELQESTPTSAGADSQLPSEDAEEFLTRAESIRRCLGGSRSTKRRLCSSRSKSNHQMCHWGLRSKSQRQTSCRVAAKSTVKKLIYVTFQGFFWHGESMDRNHSACFSKPFLSVGRSAFRSCRPDLGVSFVDAWSVCKVTQACSLSPEPQRDT